MSDTNDSEKAYVSNVVTVYDQYDRMTTTCSGFYFSFFADAKRQKCERQKELFWKLIEETKAEVSLTVSG